jgi:hypothetical protein
MRTPFWRARLGWLLALVLMPATTVAQPQMDLRQASGVPLPATDLPAGTVSVRVVRDSFANNLSGVDVVFTVNGRATTMTTDAGGRAQISGLAPGDRLTAVAIVDGERLVTQAATVADTGIRFVLVAGDGTGAGASPAPAPGAAGLAAEPGAPGSVTFGPESRIVLDYSAERLSVYYVLQVVNPAGTPVDLGGPITIELPESARGAAVIEGTTASATANGARITVIGPFAPGTSNVNAAFELPFSGATATLEQAWPVPLQGLTVFALQSGALDLQSEQFTTKQATVEQGQPLVVGFVSAIPAGESLGVEITGLPHHAVWPRNTALALGGVIAALGIWAAVVPGPRRRAA